MKVITTIGFRKHAAELGDLLSENPDISRQENSLPENEPVQPQEEHSQNYPILLKIMKEEDAPKTYKLIKTNGLE